MNKKWWKEAVVYQIYPRSFYDSNGDGIGDIPGIIEKLDYLKDLGIDVIWLSPVYQSPNDDNGYDISDYYDIMDEFGTMQDMESLLEKAHQRDIKIIMDLVVNHTSDEHPWFKKSCRGIEPYQDFYIWEKGCDGQPPNNWGAVFGGSTWEYIEERGAYYLHIFSRKQPDLNWENQKVREKVYEMMKWWLDKGIDGFRMDVINFLSKDLNFPDGEKGKNDKYGDGSPYYTNGSKIHQYLQEMNKEVLSKYDVMTVGETPDVTPEDGLKYVGEDRSELNMVFHFEIMNEVDVVDNKWEQGQLDLLKLKEIIKKWYLVLKKQGWNSIYLNNHDRPRMVSRYGDDKRYRKESAKMLAAFNMTLPGTPYIYQGEELGMTNIEFDSIDQYRDIDTLNRYRELQEKGVPEEKIMEQIYWASRDNARTPVQWDDSKNAGFTAGNPWIGINPNYQTINAAAEREDPESVFNYYKGLLRLRKDKRNQALIYGEYIPLAEDDKRIYSYYRKLGDDKLLIILNFSAEKPVYDYLNDQTPDDVELLISNYNIENPEEINKIRLRPYEARVYRV